MVSLSVDSEDKAWGRIGRDPWYYMAWFVKLANSAIEDMSEGDLKNLQEECQVMRGLYYPFRKMEKDRKRYPFLRGGKCCGPPTVQQLIALQAIFASHLSAVAEGREVKLGPFIIQHETRFKRSTEAEKRGGYPNYRIYPIEILQASATIYAEQELLIRLAKLLESFVERVRRCPHCNKLFLQLRRNATYCGRACHSVAGMQKLRASRVNQRRARNRPKKKG